MDNLNKLLPGSEYEGMALEEIIRKAPAGAVFNNAGQILNHEMYFMQFKPASEAVQGPEGALAAQIEKLWGSVEAFKAEFEAKGVGLFGSGWVWLSTEVMPFYDVRSQKDEVRWKKKADCIMSFILDVGNFGHNRDQSYLQKYPFLIRKTISLGRRCADLLRHARIFPLDSMRFFPGIIFNGLRSAVNGE